MSTSGTSCAQSSKSPATISDFGTLLRPGASADVDLICYDQNQHAHLLGMIAEGSSCMAKLSLSGAGVKLTAQWYENRFLWFIIGAMAGGVGAAYVLH